MQPTGFVSNLRTYRNEEADLVGCFYAANFEHYPYG